MTANAIAISRGLVEQGVDKAHADAFAEALVTHVEESYSSKADVANLEDRLDRIDKRLDRLEADVSDLKGLRAQFNIMLAVQLVIAAAILAERF